MQVAGTWIVVAVQSRRLQEVMCPKPVPILPPGLREGEIMVFVPESPIPGTGFQPVDMDFGTGCVVFICFTLCHLLPVQTL